MRTSRVSREAAQLFSSNGTALPNTPSRKTRSALKAFSRAIQSSVADETDGIGQNSPESSSERASLSPSPLNDIEDAFTPPKRGSPASKPETSTTRKRKREAIEFSPSALREVASNSATTPSKSLSENADFTPRRSTRKIVVKEEVDIEPKFAEEDEFDDESTTTSPNTPRSKAKPKVPARKSTAEDGSVTIHPPSNWNEIYSIIKAMRQANPVAAVDTMGCEDLYWRSAPPQDKRYHTLTALMLSSQTKDTVTAAAMKRLHTELAEGIEPDHKAAQRKIPNPPDTNDQAPISPSQLTISNMIACSPTHLDTLISKVGFHNNKTKYIKATALILRNNYNSDIPSTISGLTSLPGVGPKMAYLCMSAAWGIDEGIGVDVHVHRITNLWGWHKTKTPEETRAWLEGWLPKDRWHEINKMLVGLGQTVCLPVGRRCGECWLAGKGLCKSEIRGWKAKVKVEKKRVVKEEGE
ncbi:MAG: hypothetical protein Q9160_006595 [Pyrenula sp. 1 TL-2023]